jgi:hypothetical protein
VAVASVASSAASTPREGAIARSSRLVSRFADLRAAIRDDRDLAIDAASSDDQLDLPF